MIHVPTTTGDFAVDRKRHLQALAERLPAEVEKLTWPLERLHALRDERLRELVRIAKERSPWHARRLRHVDPETLRGEDLSLIPPMTKADLMAHWDEIITDRRMSLQGANAHIEHLIARGPSYYLGDNMVIASGGSSGLRGVFAWDFEGWLRAFLVTARHEAWHARRRSGAERRVAIVMAGRAFHLSIAMTATFVGGATGPLQRFPVDLPLPELVAGLNAFQPTNLIVYPSILHLLALEAREGRLRINLGEILCSGEPLPPETRQEAREVFGSALLRNAYGCSELGSVAEAYPGQEALHLAEDSAVYEPVDADNRPVPAGTMAAKLLLTNVLNPLLPLIRYELTDEVTFLTEPSPGPWTGRRIEVSGRFDDLFTYEGGQVVHPSIFWTALGHTPDIREFQVHQTPRGVEALVQTVPGASLEPVRRDIVDALKRLGLVDPTVTVRAVETLERLPGTGKLKRFIPLRRT